MEVMQTTAATQTHDVRKQPTTNGWEMDGLLPKIIYVYTIYEGQYLRKGTLLKGALSTK
jgi:hypothetical protein